MNRCFRAVLPWMAGGLLLLLAVVPGVAIGRYGLSPATLFRLLCHGPASDPAAWLIVTQVRLPRVLTSLLAGVGLAIAGAALQGVFRNPLVGPQTIGVANGAAVGGVLAILFCGIGPAVVGAAFAGAALALAAVLSLQKADSPQAVLTLILAGVVVGAFCGGVTGALTFVADPETSLPGIVFWLLGSFATASWQKLALLAPCVVPASVLLLLMRWRINVLSLGDDEARALGARPAADRTIVLALVCLIVAGQVAVSGVVGWVGLVIPNLARLLAGADHRRVMPLSALLGGVFLTLTDTLARTVSAAEIPIGVVTALLGAPVFAAILRSRLTERLP
jgi:iron complex transport system permease protein